MTRAFAWWFAFACAVAVMVGSFGVLCSFDKHKSVAACCCAVLTFCLGFGLVGVTVGHAVEVCSQNVTQRNGGC